MPHPNYPNAFGTVHGGGLLQDSRYFVGNEDRTHEVLRAAEQVKRTPQIAESLKRLGACLDDMASAMGALQARIDPVLRPIDHAQAGDSASAPEPVRCDLAAQIESQCNRLCGTTELLRDILDRLEV